METHLISILLPTYNGAHYIREAIESVLLQDYQNFEFIILDDASTDSTPEIVREYQKKDNRIVIVRNEKNLKLVGTLNRGISLARGEYIARIDDDDIWTDRSKLTKQMEIFSKNPRLGVVGTWGKIIDDTGKYTGGSIHHAYGEKKVKDAFGLRNQLIHTSILAKTHILKEASGYSQDWLYVEDFDLWLRILALGHEIDNLPEECISYRVRAGSTTGKKYRRMQWLTFSRLFHEKNLSSSVGKRWIRLFIRFMLIIIPSQFIYFLGSLKNTLSFFRE